MLEIGSLDVVHVFDAYGRTLRGGTVHHSEHLHHSVCPSLGAVTRMNGDTCICYGTRVRDKHILLATRFPENIT